MCMAAAVTTAGVAVIGSVVALQEAAERSRVAAMESEAAAASATAAVSVRVELERLRGLLQVQFESAHPQEPWPSAGAVVVLGRAPPRVRNVEARRDDGAV